MKSIRVAVSVAVMLVAAGCGGDKLAENVIERQIESQSGEDIDIDIDDGDISIETEDGTIIGSTDGDLPEGFPADVPLPAGLQIETSTAMTVDDGQSFVVGGSIDGAPGDVLADYTASLEDAGFTQQSLTTMPDGGFLAYDNGVWGVGGSVGQGSDGGTGIAVTVIPSDAG